MFLYLGLNRAALEDEHLPRIQQMLDEQCGPGIMVNREGFRADDGVLTWKDHARFQGPGCWYDWYEDEWVCSC